jgi:hypothetical protein
MPYSVEFEEGKKYNVCKKCVCGKTQQFHGIPTIPEWVGSVD